MGELKRKEALNQETLNQANISLLNPENVTLSFADLKAEAKFRGRIATGGDVEANAK